MQGKCKENANLYWTDGRVDKTRTTEMQGKCKFVLDLWKAE